MEVSPGGLLVACTVALAGYALGSAVHVGLLIAIAFGATSIGAIPALGGSSPQIFTVFAVALVGVALMRRGSVQDLYRLFRHHGVAALAVALGVYSVAGAFAFPRMFAGETSAFIAVAGRIFEAPLSPVSGNMSQTLYFVLGIAAFIALSAYLIKVRRWEMMTTALLAFAATNGLLGLIDITAKIAGIPDVLEPVRTANYAFLTSAFQSSFWRISGGQSEASAFAQSSLASLGVAFCYWRVTGSTPALAIASLNAALLVFSTSSTAYIALAVLVAAAAVRTTFGLLEGKLRVRDVHLLLVIVLAGLVVIVLWVLNVRSVHQFVDLLDSMVLRKASSDSGTERTYWNTQSLAAFVATGGAGIGFGSSRASSWIVAVVSQLGVIGTLAMFGLIFSLNRDASRAEVHARRAGPAASEYLGLASAARGGAVASLVGSSVSGASADPGILFFICLAIVTALCVAVVPARNPVGVPKLRMRRRVVHVPAE